MMLKTILRMTAIVASSLVPLGPAAAEDDAKLVESVSPQIADVVTGGSWSDGKQGGLYRAFVVMSGSGDDFGARLYRAVARAQRRQPDPERGEDCRRQGD